MKNYRLILFMSLIFVTFLNSFTLAADLTKAQIYLNKMGFSAGEADGLWGRNTEKAVKEFNEFHGLIWDGSFDDGDFVKIQQEFIKLQDIAKLGNISIKAKGSWLLHSFEEKSMSLDYCYAGKDYESHLISNVPQVTSNIDISSDGDDDVILPILRGYRSGLDTRQRFIVFENVEGELRYSSALRSNLPLMPGPGAGGSLDLTLSSGEKTLVSVQHGTQSQCGDSNVPWYFGSISIVNTHDLEDLTSNLIPDDLLPLSTLAKRSNAVQAHAFAVGDFNHDGLDDILIGERIIGEYKKNYYPFILTQTKDSSFEIFQYDFLSEIGGVWHEPKLPGGKGNYITKFHVADLDLDGFDDLVAGWSNGDAFSRVFWGNQSGQFNLQESAILPKPTYGTDNSIHINTWSFDYDLDEDLDILVQYLPYRPYYGGQYLQLYENKNRSFQDVTDDVLLKGKVFLDKFTEEFEWGEHWYLKDINFDGLLDIVGQSSHYSRPIIYLFVNQIDGFDFRTIEFNEGIPVAWGDFDQNGKIEFLSYLRETVSDNPWRSVMQVFHYEID